MVEKLRLNSILPRGFKGPCDRPTARGLSFMRATGYASTMPAILFLAAEIRADPAMRFTVAATPDVCGGTACSARPGPIGAAATPADRTDR